MPCKSGWPSGMRFNVNVLAAGALAAGVFAAGLGACPETGALTRIRAAKPVKLASGTCRWRKVLPPSVIGCQRHESTTERLLPKFAVHQFFHKLHALEIQELHVLLLTLVQRHADLPRPREDFGVLNGRFIRDYVRTLAGVALH